MNRNIPLLNSRSVLLSLGVVAATTFAPILRADLRSLLSRSVDVMTVTDVKPDGKTMPIPSREHPIYYEGINAGFKDWARPMAGDTVPDSKKMQDAVVRALAKNGYLSADDKHPGTEIIVMSWGTFYGGKSLLGNAPALRFLGGDKFDDVGEIDEGSSFSANNASVQHRIIPNYSQSKLHEFAAGNLYIALLRAYSVGSANKGKIAELWETRVACPSDGLALSDTLPTMIQLAAPHIGLDTAKPVFASPEKDLHENIQEGELQVVDYVDVDKAHVTSLKELTQPEKKTDEKAK